MAHTRCAALCCAALCHAALCCARLCCAILRCAVSQCTLRILNHTHTLHKLQEPSQLQITACMQLFDWIYIGEVGAHDGDWEHVTLRLTPDASQVLGIYYSAHR